MHQYEDCLVSFIDILGFRSLVMERTAEEIYQTISALKKFTLPDDHGVKAESMDQVRLYSRAFSESISDAIVRVRPFNTQYRDGALFYELLDLLYAQIDLINNGILIRAGMAIGNCHAGYNGEGPFFGPALIKAYEIESEGGKPPIIAIDDQVLEEHKNNIQLQAEQNTTEYELKTIRKIIKQDTDGLWFIDYLGSHAEFDELGSYFEFLQTHASLVREGISKNHNNDAVLLKYEWLKKYHNEYVKKWADGALKDNDTETAFANEFDVDPAYFFSSILIK